MGEQWDSTSSHSLHQPKLHCDMNGRAVWQYKFSLISPTKLTLWYEWSSGIAGLPLVSILRRSLGLPATALRGSLGNFKGSSLIWNSSCAEVFCFAYDALCPFYISVLGSVLSDNVTFSCTLLGMLAYYSSNRFIQRPILVVLHVSSILVVGSPANSVDVFYSIHLWVWNRFFKQHCKKAKGGTFKHKTIKKYQSETSESNTMFLWNK